MKNFKYLILALYASFLLYSCRPASGNYPGSEYMPDMAHAISYEANYYTPYSLHQWDSASVVSYKSMVGPRLPVKGTVARGYAGLAMSDQAHRAEVMASLDGSESINAISVPLNGNVPFPYENSEEERLRAMAEIIANPFPISAQSLEKGKELYTIFCAICHGDKADGTGYLVAESNPNARYPAAPANLLLDDFVNSSNGRYYYTVMYGRNLMGSYEDKLNYEERWDVIHYIRSLQAKDRKLEYSENANTLNPAYGTPAGQMEKLAAGAPDEPASEAAGSGNQRSDQDGHSGGSR